MVKERRSYNCTLDLQERRLYCFKKRASKACLKPRFLGYRCPNLVYEKADVMDEAKKGAKKITAPAGFTEEAQEYVKRYRPKLKLVQDYLTAIPAQ